MWIKPECSSLVVQYEKVTQQVVDFVGVTKSVLIKRVEFVLGHSRVERESHNLYFMRF